MNWTKKLRVFVLKNYIKYSITSIGNVTMTTLVRSVLYKVSRFCKLEIQYKIDKKLRMCLGEQQ